MRISDWSSDVCSSDLSTALEMHEGETTPPPPLTEAELIRKMDDNGIGTDATIATHIQTIQVDRKSVVSGKRVSVRVDLGVRRFIKKIMHHVLHLHIELHSHHLLPSI